jgi:heat shock protein HtpX
VPIAEHIVRNRRQSAALLGAFALVVLAIGALLAILAGPLLLVAAAIVALVLVAVAYLFGDRVVLRLSHAGPASVDDEPRYHNLVEGLCVSAGLPKPELYLIDDDAPNSFATGRSPAHASIVVTTGLLEKLSRMELEGVLAHELSHIRSNDILVTTLGTALVALPLMPAGPLAGRLLSSLVGRGRERDADLGGVTLTRYPPGLAAALEKLRRDGPAVLPASRATAHLWISSPLDAEDGATRLEARIAALREM